MSVRRDDDTINKYYKLNTKNRRVLNYLEFVANIDFSCRMYLIVEIISQLVSIILMT